MATLWRQPIGPRNLFPRRGQYGTSLSSSLLPPSCPPRTCCTSTLTVPSGLLICGRPSIERVIFSRPFAFSYTLVSLALGPLIAIIITITLSTSSHSDSTALVKPPRYEKMRSVFFAAALTVTSAVADVVYVTDLGLFTSLVRIFLAWTASS